MEHRKSRRTFENWLSVPFIYAVFFPVVLLDIFFEIYHRVCFPLYGLNLVDRSAYIRLDRHRLSYLSPLERINCLYCGYVNGFLPYVTEIAARTERYWCGIKHAPKEGSYDQPHQADWPAYGDPEAFTERYGPSRRRE